MAVEDFSTYTELDGNSRITVTESRVTVAALSGAEDAWVYKDMTAGYFDGDFTHLLTVCMTAGTTDGRVRFWALTNTVDDIAAIVAASGSTLDISFSKEAATQSLVLNEYDSGSAHSSSYNISLNTVYYLKIVRDEAASPQGTLYCYVYSDSGRSTLLDTLAVTLTTSKKDFRYLFVALTSNTGHAGRTISGYCENLDLIGGSSGAETPTVITYACSSVIAESSTGNGYLVSLGASAVTAHGFCWNTTTNPTVSGGANYLAQVDIGAAPNLTHFEALMTGLIPGTLYYVRAFATNTSGTAYGENVTIAGDVTTIGRRYWSVQGEDFTWFGESGTRRKAQGTAVASDQNILSYF